MVWDMKLKLTEFTAITKALSDPHRVRALFALRGGELCGCQIIELLQLAPSTVSKHMTILKQAGLVKNRKEERWIYYRLPGQNEISEDIAKTVMWLSTALAADTTLQRDLASLRKITDQSVVALCKARRGDDGR